ncbi:MAG: MG2 domain-containing protein, partial [Acidobacteriota bacterium]
MNDTINTPRRRLLGLSLIPIVLAALIGGSVALGGPDPTTGPPATVTPAPEEAPLNWKSVDRLIADQKFQAALDMVTQLRDQATAEKNTEDWTRALVEATQLRVALHGYETAVKELLENPWPEDPTSRAILDLYTAQAMVTYAQQYSWEVRERERIISDDQVDLKRWTHDQIVAAAHQAYGRMWAQRDDWGDGPLGDFSRYLFQNSYPPRIRGTLRDAISYLWVDLLEDSSLWRPEDESEIYRLDLEALAEGNPRLNADQMADTAIHPLERMAAILGDLERWHQGADRTEAALEARLSRVRRLHSAVEDSEDEVTLRQGLQSTLQDIDPQLEWWAMGQATVAGFEQQEETPDALIRARETALSGLERHSAGVAAQACRHIVAEIEAPRYSVGAMSNDGVGRRSIRVNHRNMNTLFFRAYELDLEEIIRSGKDYNLLPGHREVPTYLAHRSPVAQWSVDLPPTTDYRDHHTDVVPPLNSKGAYLVIASAREDFKAHANRRLAFNFIISDLVLIRRPLEGRWEITARHGFSGDALPDVEMDLYRADWRKGHRRIATYRTASDGRVTIDLDDRSHRYYLLARHGEDLDLDGPLSPTYDSEPGHTKAALLYTDRSVYRPQQTIHWKVLPFSGGGEDHQYETLPNTQTTVTLKDGNREEVASQTVTTNNFGSASGSFEIPAGRMLGQWSLETSVGYSSTSIRVEEYKRPTFTVEITDPAEALRLNRPAVLSGQVDYYFGLPVAEGDIRWKVTREPVYPRWWSWWRPWPVAPSRVVASGDGRIEADGSFEIAFTPEADEREAERGVTYRFRLTVDATDPGGETRSADRSFRLGFTAVEATIDLGGGFVPSHQAHEISILRTDLDAIPRPGSGTWRLVGLANPPQTLTPAQEPVAVDEENPHQIEGDRTRPRWNTS